MYSMHICTFWTRCLCDFSEKSHVARSPTLMSLCDIARILAVHVILVIVVHFQMPLAEYDLRDILVTPLFILLRAVFPHNALLFQV